MNRVARAERVSRTVEVLALHRSGRAWQSGASRRYARDAHMSCRRARQGRRDESVECYRRPGRLADQMLRIPRVSSPNTPRTGDRRVFRQIARCGAGIHRTGATLGPGSGSTLRFGQPLLILSITLLLASVRRAGIDGFFLRQAQIEQDLHRWIRTQKGFGKQASEGRCHRGGQLKLDRALPEAFGKVKSQWPRSRAA